VFVSGIYQVQRVGAGETVERFAVNVDTAEGRLDRYDAAQLPSQFIRGLDEATNDEGIIAPYARTSFARWALAAVVGLLLLESSLAWHFGTARV
jgi:hypothetical protein